MSFPYPFAKPAWLGLLLLIPLALGWRLWKSRSESGLQFSTASLTAGLRPTLRVYLRHTPMVLRSLAVGLAIIALARPQERNVTRARFAAGSYTHLTPPTIYCV